MPFGPRRELSAFGIAAKPPPATIVPNISSYEEIAKLYARGRVRGFRGFSFPKCLHRLLYPKHSQIAIILPPLVFVASDLSPPVPDVMEKGRQTLFAKALVIR